LIKLLPCVLFEKYIYILALETAIPGNQRGASCIGTLSFLSLFEMADILLFIEVMQYKYVSK